MYQEWNNLRSTKSSNDSVTEKTYNQDQFTNSDPSGIQSHALYADITKVTGQNTLAWTSVFSNYLHLVTKTWSSYTITTEITSISIPRGEIGASITTNYKRDHQLFKSIGPRPQLHKLYNESSKELQLFITSETVDYQSFPPRIHRHNSTERAIRTFKNHFFRIVQHR